MVSPLRVDQNIEEKKDGGMGGHIRNVFAMAFFWVLVLVGNAYAEPGAPVPEPATVILLGAGLLGGGLYMRNLRKRK